MHPALTILLMLLAGLAAIVPFVYVRIQQMGKTRLLLSASEAEYGNQFRVAESHGPWAEHFGFEWIGGYAFRSIQKRFIGAWRHQKQPVFFLLEISNGATHYEFRSTFNRDQELSSMSHNGLVLPEPPGRFVQRFPNAPLTELFLHHAEAHDLLVDRGVVQLTPFPLRVDRAVVGTLGKQYKHVTELGAWPLRALSWVLIDPRKARNRSVAQRLGDDFTPIAADETRESDSGDDEAEAEADGSA